jgi:EAL domain-containing protein (putative c-di-GMP-specific phosphodiesterase class I)
VIAEGIETREQQQERRLGCVLGRGYLFAKPMPIAEARRLLVRPVYGAGAGASRADAT